MFINSKSIILKHSVLVFITLFLSSSVYGLDEEQQNESIKNESTNNDVHPTILNLLTCSIKAAEITDQQGQSIQNFFNNNFKKKENESFFIAKDEVEFLGIKVTNAFPESLGTLPAFALHLDADVKTVIAALPDDSIQKKQCIDLGCQYKISEDKTFMLSSASIWFGKSEQTAKTTIFGCMYPYKR